MEKVNGGPIQSVSRAAAILRCFYDRESMSLHEISQQVGLHKSTTSTLVTTLKNERLLEQDPVTGQYRLGMSAFLLGASAKINIRTIVQPYLTALNERFRETVNLAAPDGTDIVYINKLESEYSMRTCTRIGQRLPFYCTANGKAIFAYYSPERLRRCVESLNMTPFTPNTICEPGRLMQELVEAKANGYACDNEELEQGLCCFAAPIFDSTGAPAAAVSLSGPHFRMDGERREEMIAALKACAGEVTATLSRASYIASGSSFD